MAVFFDYLEWRGDLSFDEAPFNAVDNTVLCEAAYVDWDGVVPGLLTGGDVPLAEVMAAYIEKHPDDESVPLGLIIPAKIKPLVRAMAKTKRFGTLSMLGYTDRLDGEREEQFSAVTFVLPGGELFVAYRGTDDTLVGWKENLNMGLALEVPAQRDAADYLNQVANLYPERPLYVGGHSKGGNLAVYAAVCAAPEVRVRIRRVWSNDGPGFMPAFLQSSAYSELRDRIDCIVPENSVIGRMLEHDAPFIVVKSDVSGLWQHDAFTWQVSGNDYVHAPNVSEQSDQIDFSLKSWMYGLSMEEREAFIDALYRMLTATGSETLLELTHGINWFWRVLSAAAPEDRKAVFTSLTNLTGEAGRVWMERVLPFLGKNAGNRQYAGAENGFVEKKTGEPANAAEKAAPKVARRSAVCAEEIRRKVGNVTKDVKNNVKNAAAKGVNKAQATYRKATACTARKGKKTATRARCGLCRLAEEFVSILKA